MKILEISCQGGIGTPNSGPVTNVIEQLAREFDILGHDVTVADCMADLERTLLPANIGIVELNAPPMHKVFKAMRPTGGAKLKKALDENMAKIIQELLNTNILDQFDVVHTHDSQIAVALSRIPGVTCVYTCHTPNNWIDQMQYQSLFGRLRLLRLKFGGYFGHNDLRAIRVSQKTIALGPHLTEAVCDLYGSPALSEKLLSIPNGMNLDQWPAMSREEARSSLNFDADQFRLQFTGRLTPSKGLETLLEATRLLSPTIPELHVSIVGADQSGGAYTASLAEAAKVLPITYHGYMSNRTIEYRKLLAAADLTIVPSLRDNQPTVVMESLALGVPVIGSNVAGIPMMLSPDVGRLFEPGNATELADIILDLYKDRKALHNMRSAARAHVEKEYSWREVADRYVAAFDSAVKQA